MKQNQFRTIIGVDLGDKKHHVCITDKDGAILSERTITNRREQLQHLTKEFPKALFAIEVGTHSPWVSRILTENSCTCVVANARKLRAIYTNDRKCDQLDARMLAKLARVDPELLSPIEHCSEENQNHRLALTLRDSLVRQRVNLISTIRTSLKSLGMRLPSCSTPAFVNRCRNELGGTPTLGTVEHMLNALEQINSSINHLDKQIAATAKEHHPETRFLEQIAGVGTITALSYVLAVGDPDRFKDPRDVAAYLGLIPRRDQSGKSDKQLSISKAGNREVRRLLVQSAQYIMGHHGPDCDLKRHGLMLAAKGGKSAKRKAIIAIARKLSVLLLVLWSNQATYEPFKNNTKPATKAA